MRTLLPLALSILILAGPGLAPRAEARGDRARVAHGHPARGHGHPHHGGGQGHGPVRPPRPPKAKRTIVGGIAVDVPLAKAKIALADAKGRPVQAFGPSAVSSTGRFRLGLKDHRLAQPDGSLAFRATAVGALAAEPAPRARRSGRPRPQAVTLRAVVRGFDPARDELHLNAVTTLIAAYLDAHPRRTLEEATATVKAFLDIPDYVDVGDVSAGIWLFDHARFFDEAQRNGGVDRFVAKLVREIDAGRVHGFRAAQPPALSGTGSPLTCINTVAWDHGADTSLPPYVQVGDAKYSRQIVDGIQVVVLDRQSLAHVDDTVFPGDANGVGSLQSYLARWGPGNLVIVAGPWGVASLASPTLETIGASELMDQGGTPATPAGDWSVIGIPGLPYGQAWQTSYNVNGVDASLPNCQGTSDGDRGANLSGYFTLDATGVNYTFVFPDFIYFDTRVPGAKARENTMQIGDELFTDSIALPGVVGGFHLLGMDRRTGEVITPRALATVLQSPLGDALEPDTGGVESLTELLNDSLEYSDPTPGEGDGPNQVIYFLTSIGQPAVVETAAFDATMANALLLLGVNPHTFMTLTRDDTWSLVAYQVSDAKLGQPFAFQSSSRITPDDPAGRQVGFLARNKRNHFVPWAADQSGELTYELLPLALQPASPWPFANTSGYQSANAWIANQLALPIRTDVRLNYPEIDADWGGLYYALLSNIAYPGSAACGCSQDEYDDLKAELLLEFGWVDSVARLLDNLKSPLDTAEFPEAVDLTSIAAQIEQSVSPPNSNTQISFWSMLEGIASGVSSATGVPGLGLAVAGFKMAYDLANGGGGASLDPVRAEAQQLGAAVANVAATAVGTFDQLHDIIVSDYGRLSAIGQNAQSNPDWAWTGSDLNAATTFLTQSANRVFWGALMPLEYSAYKLIPTSPNNLHYTSANDYVCEAHDPETGMSHNVKPFHQAVPSGQFEFVVDYASSQPEVSFWVWYQSVNNQGESTLPPESLTDPLFESTEAANGVGLYAADFWWQNWQPDDLECPPDKFGEPSLD